RPDRLAVRLDGKLDVERSHRGLRDDHLRPAVRRPRPPAAPPRASAKVPVFENGNGRRERHRCLLQVRAFICSESVAAEHGNRGRVAWQKTKLALTERPPLFDRRGNRIRGVIELASQQFDAGSFSGPREPQTHESGRQQRGEDDDLPKSPGEGSSTHCSPYFSMSRLSRGRDTPSRSAALPL